MTDDSRLSLDTKEFVAGWQSIVEDHVVQDLIGAVRRLSAPESGGPEGLARHLSHAFQITAAPGGGVQAGVQYLCEMAQQARPNGAT
jgi:hypothetical protein